MARALLGGEAGAGFCAVRPSGHHAEPDRAMGFCLFDNVAVAAELAIRELGAGAGLHPRLGRAPRQRHRRGVSPPSDVLFASIHQAGIFPGTGAIADVGTGPGEGYTINLPVPAGSEEELWLSLLEHIVLPPPASFGPELVLISAGFDAHAEDPLADCRLTAASFAQMARHVRDLAREPRRPRGSDTRGRLQPRGAGRVRVRDAGRAWRRGRGRLRRARGASDLTRGRPHRPLLASLSPSSQAPTSIEAMEILIVEDEAAIADFLVRGLRAEGYTVHSARDAAEGERAALARAVDLVILDRMLPQGDGLEVLGAIRAAKPALPVIVLTAKAEIGDRIEGLDRGATDYMIKPFSFEELAARVRAHLRQPRAETATTLEAADIRLDLLSRRAERDGRSVRLAERESDLLAHLMRNAGRVCTHGEILSSVWGYDHDPRTNVVQVYIGYLRRRLALPGSPAPIETVRSVGYRLAARR